MSCFPPASGLSMIYFLLAALLQLLVGILQGTNYQQLIKTNIHKQANMQLGLKMM